MQAFSPTDSEGRGAVIGERKVYGSEKKMHLAVICDLLDFTISDFCCSSLLKGDISHTKDSQLSLMCV